MADLNCKACEDLEKEVPSLIVNGLTNSMCTSLQNDTGLKASSDNDDCEDLNDLNDCLVGNMETEIDRYDTCEWKEFMKNFINNLWTTLKAMICAICGIWTNIHNLWKYAKSYKLKKVGNKIILEAEDGEHGRVTDDDTTYSLSISGHKITLTGSDGSTDTVTVPDDNTKYNISISGHKITLTGTDGSTDSVTVPDANTTYTISRSGHTVTLNGSDGSTDSVTLPDENTWQANTKTQEGYVKKGEDDEHSVWATNASGVPDWRSDVTLDGGLTLYDHDGPIGERKWWQLDNVKPISNDTNMMIPTIKLTPGVWVVLAVIGYDVNGDGGRAIGLSFGSSAAHHKGMNVRANTSAHTTVLSRVYIRAVSAEDGEVTVYLDAYQDSGRTLNITTYPETYVSAVRIR